MRSRTATSPDAPTLVVTGDLDRDSAGELHRACAAALTGPGRRQLDLNLAEVPFIDAAGVRCLLACRQLAADAGGRLTVTAAAPEVLQIFDITGLTEILGVER